MSENYKYFCNKECEYYPCHNWQGEFNCLFCYCPLYVFDNCGGNYTRNKQGVKDCTKCFFPHFRENYDKVIDKLKELCYGGKNGNNKEDVS